MAHRSLHDLLAEMAADAEVVDEVVRAARTESPEVARLPVDENRRHVAIVLAAGLASFDRPGGAGEQDYAAAADLGADRAAQGVPLAALLRGVQAGRSRAVEIAVGRGKAAGVPDDVMLAALVDFDRNTRALERQVIAGYHEAELELARTAHDSRARVLRRLLGGDAAAPSAEEVANAGLNPGGRYHCLLSDVGDPYQARVVERRLGATGGVFGLVEGRLAGLAPRLPTPSALGDDVLMVASPAVPLAEVRGTYALCVMALPTAARSRGLHAVADLAVETALAAQPGLAALLEGTLLNALTPGDPFHEQLVSTALAYLDHGRRLDQTAAALHVHANTVRYRLSRLGEITGTSLDPPEEDGGAHVRHTVSWWWALRTWRSG
ncbi:CdaR family transcriptional regulator [Amycolatopsis sp. TNS106]|uniref:PucR family transcriptional regulator n=1 Tax=Amycolatopsis sp. TNS106 TaxID=2861750 RepID=UPI001C55E5F4|nr:helix-turn-helix domain-containing protein [Amycolatopsis sp. TNS106]QXV59452.1 PucR family transcriptional regulator [Amycolatopsis sp. TNS106]